MAKGKQDKFAEILATLAGSVPADAPCRDGACPYDLAMRKEGKNEPAKCAGRTACAAAVDQLEALFRAQARDWYNSQSEGKRDQYGRQRILRDDDPRLVFGERYEDLEGHAARRENGRELIAWLERTLTPRQLAGIACYYWRGDNDRQTGQLLEISTRGASKHRLAALERLRKALQEDRQLTTWARRLLAKVGCEWEDRTFPGPVGIEVPKRAFSSTNVEGKFWTYEPSPPPEARPQLQDPKASRLTWPAELSRKHLEDYTAAAWAGRGKPQFMGRGEHWTGQAPARERRPADVYTVCPPFDPPGPDGEAWTYTPPMAAPRDQFRGILPAKLARPSWPYCWARPQVWVTPGASDFAPIAYNFGQGDPPVMPFNLMRPSDERDRLKAALASPKVRPSGIITAAKYFGELTPEQRASGHWLIIGRLTKAQLTPDEYLHLTPAEQRTVARVAVKITRGRGR